MSVPKEHRKYYPVPIEKLDSIDWDQTLDPGPLRWNDMNPAVNAERTKFMVRCDGRERKPYCLYGITGYTHAEAWAGASDPESEWYIDSGGI